MTVGRFDLMINDQQKGSDKGIIKLMLKCNDFYKLLHELYTSHCSQNYMLRLACANMYSDCKQSMNSSNHFAFTYSAYKKV